MIFKKGEGAKKLPPHESILGIHVIPSKGEIYAGRLITASMLASYRREGTPLSHGNWFFYVDGDGYLHIYPYPEKSLRVKITYRSVRIC